MDIKNKKRIYITALALVLASGSSGCALNPYYDYYENMSTEETTEEEKDETTALLDKYNEHLNKELTISDLKILSNLDDIFSIKLENGKYVQISKSAYNIEKTSDGENIIVLNYDKNNYDLLSQKELGSDIDVVSKENIGEFMEENNIGYIGYTAQKLVSYSSSDKEFIVNKYGNDTFEVIKSIGLPVKLFDSKSFRSKEKKYSLNK